MTTYTVGRFGGTHSIRRVICGGFRTRYRVQAVRALWAAARTWLTREGVWEVWRSAWEETQRRDHQRVCPHLIWEPYAHGRICAGCGVWSL